MEIDSPQNPMLIPVKSAYNAFLELGSINKAVRSLGVQAMAEGVKSAFNEILEANTLDLETSREMAVPDLILDWLKLTPERLETTVAVLERLARLTDPTKKLLSAPYQLEPAQTYCQLMPLGVIAFIYEGFPELAIIAAGMCLKTGNSLILRGASMASHSNAVIAKVLHNALEESGLPINCLEVISADRGDSIQDLVTCDRYINLVVPYGRPSFIQQVIQQSTAPVLRSAMGNCYLYWSSSGDLELARWTIVESQMGEPDPVNAIEKVLIDANKKPALVQRLLNSLQENGFKLKGDKLLLEEFPEHLTPISEAEWGKPYLNRTIAFQMVENIDEAIEKINRYSSGHADCLITESYEESYHFAQNVDSALVFINSSPRFSRLPKRGESVFLGISNQKGSRRGLIGLETLTTFKQVIQGGERI